MVVKTEMIHMKERDRYIFYLCSDKSDLKDFQRNFQTFFRNYLSQSDTCQLEST